MKVKKLQDIIIGETDGYIIINKPPHFASLDDRHDGNSIIELAREFNEEIQVCHRLDKETSGILVLATNPEAYRNIAIQFEKRQVEKVYHAVVDGLHEIDSIQVDAPLRITSRGKVVVDFNEGKPSSTKIKTARLYKRHTLIYCKPITGRMHQIRVHAQYLKAPLGCDEVYGGKPVLLSKIKKNFNLKKDTEERPIIQRVALHAAEISFTNTNGELVTFEAPYPKDFRVLITQLEKNS